MWTDDQIKDFYQNYRESLSKQYESSLQELDQQRKNAQASIMSGANKAGMMYSNFPARSKIQYDMSTYTPAQVKIRNTYQTGLDTLRNNILKYHNSILDIQEAINALNSMYGSTGGNNGTTKKTTSGTDDDDDDDDDSSSSAWAAGAGSGKAGGGGGGGGFGGR